ncbi:MAG: HAD-IA family hydrolase [Lacunisphaera sp.]
MKTFVFDADGVICVGESFSAALEARHHIPHEHLMSFFNGPFPECIRGRLDLKEVITPYLVEWGWPRSVEDLLAFWFTCEHVLCSEALACVRALTRKGHVCVLGTNQEKYRAAYLRREMRLAEEFDRIFVSCDLGAAKPAVAFFAHIQEQLQCPPRSLCLVDDSEKNVAGARAAGWHAIWYRGVASLSAIEQVANASA